ncbi:hypothetical protein FPE01S_01_02600 [Flavihumibacter petaseus NBRC 106054]|uniref:Cytochrome c domain-containing protein n=2 Tax=Flavihumibacter TaxID=1004301 RepID=A0A0E9MUS7_9BACT|nr:hypothetical protein FPE01S_01_02600 [Flavihumibacter petaseus NBRC 106054]
MAWDPGKGIPIPPSPQRSGDPAKGFEYLTTGDYVKGGIPLDLFRMTRNKDVKEHLKRQGDNAGIPYGFTVITADNGEKLVAPNCLQCHAQIFNDSLIIGMGNSLMDFSGGQQLSSRAVTMAAKVLEQRAPEKYAAAKDFLQVSATVGPKLITATRGVNAADRLAAVLAAHRDPVTFKWSDSALMPLPEKVIPSDVPAWWLLKHKNAMFYNGFGRGDFGRFLMASNLLTVRDTTEAAAVDRRISDVLAWINQLQAPKYPGTVNAALAAKGQIVYQASCQKCHGHGDDYPNLLIPADIIKTDPALFSNNYQQPQFVNWFNSSWFAQGDHPARLVPFNGYIAPPLDGVWCTAPYFHNGSVPSIMAVLNSRIRPRYWSRSFDQPRYDYEQLGWVYESKTEAAGPQVYNTTLEGYGNSGHYFGDKLSDSDRSAVIEYLKTL